LSPKTGRSPGNDDRKDVSAEQNRAVFPPAAGKIKLKDERSVKNPTATGKKKAKADGKTGLIKQRPEE